MRPNPAVRTIFALGVLFILAGARMEWQRWEPAPQKSDFVVYYTAACLVHSNQSTYIYDEAERDVDPQLRIASPDTVFGQTAIAHGITEIPLYVYPPTLADLLVPLTYLSPVAAFILWQLLNIAALLSSAIMLIRMLGLKLVGHSSLILLVIFLTFAPTLECFALGQASIILLFLLTFGMSLYCRKHKGWAGLLFALAIAIKLTPLIVIVPFIAWRDWRILQAIALWGAAILGALWMINGWGTLNLYFMHLLPAMSKGVANIGDRTPLTMLSAYWGGLDRGTPPIELVWTSRLITCFALCYAGWLCRLSRIESVQGNLKVKAFAIFLLLSCCLAPISWIYAYVLSAPALAIFGIRVWEEHSNAVETTLLAMFLLSISINIFTHFTVTTPLIGVVLGIMELRRLHVERHIVGANDNLPAASVADS